MENKLEKNDILLIFAVKTNRVKEYYEKNYGKYDGEPSFNTLYIISSEIINKINDWRRFYNLLRMDRNIYRYLRIQEKEKELQRPVLNKEIEPTFEEWMWIGFKIWSTHVTISMLDEWCGNKEWEKWVKNEYNRKKIKNV